MQTVINLNTEEGITKREIIIDNSSEYRDFTMNQETEGSKNSQRTLHIQNDIPTGNITINGIVLNGIELQLLKEFINQTK